MWKIESVDGSKEASSGSFDVCTFFPPFSLSLSLSLFPPLAFYVYGIATRARRAVLCSDLQRNQNIEVYSKLRTGRDSTEAIYALLHIFLILSCGIYEDSEIRVL